MSSGLLQVFVELRNLLGTSNYVLYWIACSDSVSHNRVLVLSIPVLLLACSRDWTCNLQMIVSWVALGTKAYNCYVMCPASFFILYASAFTIKLFCVIIRTLIRESYPLQKCIWCILQRQPTGTREWRSTLHSQKLSIIGASPSECLMSYPGNLFWSLTPLQKCIWCILQRQPTGTREWRSTLHSQKLQHYWSLTIRMFSVISRKLVLGVLPLCRNAFGVFCSASQQGQENEGVLCIPKSSSIIGASPSECLVSYPGNLFWESYSSVEMQSVYSTATTDWAKLL